MAGDPRQARQPAPETPRTPGLTPGYVLRPVDGSTAAEIAEARFGGPTLVKPTPATLTTTPQVILGGNPKRVFWIAVNRGVVSAGVDIDSAMTFANSMLMGASGGYVSFDVDEDGESVAWPVFGVCESGTCPVRIFEVMRV